MTMMIKNEKYEVKIQNEISGLVQFMGFDAEDMSIEYWADHKNKIFYIKGVDE